MQRRHRRREVLLDRQVGLRQGQPWLHLELFLRHGVLAQALHDRPGAHAAIVQLNTGTTEQIVDVVQMDETRLQVMKELNRANTTTSFMWVIRGGPPEKPPDRGRRSRPRLPSPPPESA